MGLILETWQWLFMCSLPLEKEQVTSLFYQIIAQLEFIFK